MAGLAAGEGRGRSAGRRWRADWIERAWPRCWRAGSRVDLAVNGLHMGETLPYYA